MINYAPRNCWECGIAFIPNRGHQVYCFPSCARKQYDKRYYLKHKEKKIKQAMDRYWKFNSKKEPE